MIISIASGKGGTGKTLLATNLAAALTESGHVVHLLDCDVEAPNDHLFFKPVIESRTDVVMPVPAIDHNRCNLCNRCNEVCAYHAIGVFGKSVLVFPELCHSCGGCVVACPQAAIMETDKVTGNIETGHSSAVKLTTGFLLIGEAKAPPVINEMKKCIDPAAITIIDAPPGASCPVIAAIKDTDYVVLVAEASPFGLHDLKIAVQVVKKLHIPFGVVINKADSAYPNVLHYCITENIHVLSELPFDLTIAKIYSGGCLLVDRLPDYKKVFIALYNNIKELAAV
ncbi:MAG TPA: ATP-binding protein [bacterium]|nr:ATP-binding protein [bacterium]HPN45379.1 ATP-binding protein [bacterium]